MEAGAHLQQAGDAARAVHAAAGRLGDAREDLEQGALPRAVAADDADHLAALHLEGDVLERPEVVGTGGLPRIARIFEFLSCLNSRNSRQEARQRVPRRVSGRWWTAPR